MIIFNPRRKIYNTNLQWYNLLSQRHLKFNCLDYQMIILLKRGNTSTWSHNKKIRELVHRNFPSIGKNDSITTADPPDPAISGRLSFTRNAPLMARGYMDDVKCGSTRRRCSSKWSMREASIDARCFELSGRAPCTRRKASTKAEHARGQPRLLPSKKEHRATDPRETSDANIPRDAEVGLTLSLFSTPISRKVIPSAKKEPSVVTIKQTRE